MTPLVGIRGGLPQTQMARALGSLAVTQGQGRGWPHVLSAPAAPTKPLSPGWGPQRRHARAWASTWSPGRKQAARKGLVACVCSLCLCVYNSRLRLPEFWSEGNAKTTHPEPWPLYSSVSDRWLPSVSHMARGWGAHSGQRQFARWSGDTAVCLFKSCLFACMFKSCVRTPGRKLVVSTHGPHSPQPTINSSSGAQVSAFSSVHYLEQLEATGIEQLHLLLTSWLPITNEILQWTQLPLHPCCPISGPTGTLTYCSFGLGKAEEAWAL